MRLIKVRHSITDTSTSTSHQLVTAWESCYNANCMMTCEGFWYGDDTGTHATGPSGFRDDKNPVAETKRNPGDLTKGWTSTGPNGETGTCRKESKSGPPTIDINFNGVNQQPTDSKRAPMNHVKISFK